MSFVIEKDNGLIPQVLTMILDECVNGVTLADPEIEGMPIVYANKAFERLTGYGQAEIIGHNCRFLQGPDREQDERFILAAAIKKHEPCEVTLRNYRKDGELFYNRLKIKPLFNRKGEIIYYMGLQYDVTYQVNAANEIEQLTKVLNGTQPPAMNF
jgi:PAS domain S-box-containing protein